MTRIPEPRFYPRTTWMVVMWCPDRREWEPYFSPTFPKKRAMLQLEFAEISHPDREFRAVRIKSEYQVLPKGEK